MPPVLRFARPRAPRRGVLVFAALAVVALLATACVPPTDAGTPPTTQPPQATIVDCPLIGFTYGQAFGPSHSGVDMAAPEGQDVYAVRDGTLWYWSTGDVGGYSVYLRADDGNTYYYTHLTAYPSAWENTNRPVDAGDVIEHVNHTGNADGYDHLHFEVRLGGPNGTRIDPRPTFDAASCQ